MTKTIWLAQVALLVLCGCEPAPKAAAGAAQCVGLGESACNATAGCFARKGAKADAALCASGAYGNWPVFLGCDVASVCGGAISCTTDPVSGAHYAIPSTCAPAGWTLELGPGACCSGVAELADAKGSSSADATTASDLAATASAADVVAVDIGTQATSTDQACVCWPKGDGCNLPGVAYIPSDPAKACPADEVCDGDAKSYYPGGTSFGNCHKLCVLAGAKVQGTLGCSPQEKCAIVVIKDGYDKTHVAMCVPAQGALGSDQTGEPSPPKKR